MYVGAQWFFNELGSTPHHGSRVMPVLNEIAVIVFGVTLCTGLAMVFVGSLMAIASSIGQRQWPWAILIFVTSVLGVFAYTLAGDAAPAWIRRIVLRGAAVTLASAIALYVALLLYFRTASGGA